MLKLFSSATPTPSAHATAAAVRSPAAHIDYEKMASRLWRSLDRKLQSEAKNAAVRVCH